MSSTHPDYSMLAGRTFAVYLHKLIDKSFSEWVTDYGTGERGFEQLALPLLRLNPHQGRLHC